MAGTTLGTAYVQIVPSAQGISGSISNVLGEEAESAGTSVGGKIGTFAKKAILAAGVTTAVVGVVKGALSEGGKLQQSYFGGLDTLYGTAADSAREYAREAAKAGVSMNSYSEQAVSFGAALKKAYGGDAKKAVEAANTAILDMADNSAKMGTDLSSIQWAYQGFAKQNYTMLDNLKLGYGGTKSEMQRLLADAEALTGKKYDLSNLGDVYEAIHAIQENLGLAGVAAAEAEGTFTGSFGAMRAAAQNFLGQLAIGENVSESLNVLIGNATTFFFGNFIPMLGTIIKSLPGAIMTFIQQGVPMLLSGISNLVSTLASGITSSANGVTSTKITEWLTTTLPKLVSAAGDMIGKFASSLLANLPKIISAIGRIGLAIVTGLGSALWGKVTEAANGIKEKFLAPINAMKEKVNGIITKIKNLFPFKLGKIINFSLPKITLSKKTVEVLGKSITYPSGFDISWSPHAKGGIFRRPTLLQAADGSNHVVGDVRGGEAILPLTELWKHMEQMNRGVTVNVYASENQNAKDIAEEVRKVLIKETKQRRLAWQ